MNIVNKEEWIVNAAELNQRLKRLGFERGLLDVLPKPQAGGVLYGNYTGDTDDLFDIAVKVLANPKQVITVNYTLADTVVGRSALAASDLLPGIWVTLTNTCDPYQISLRSEPELKFWLADILAASSTVVTNQLGTDLSTAALLTFLAALDHTKRSRMISVLNNLEPINAFGIKDIEEQLASAKAQDFRWLLNLTDKLIPFPIEEMPFKDDLAPSIEELIKAELIEPINNEKTLFELTGEGRFFSESNRLAASKLVLASSIFISEEVGVAHDVFVFVRGPLDLIVYLMSGGEASLATLQPMEFEKILSGILGLADELEPDKPAKPVENTSPAQTVPAPPPVTPNKFCVNCGSALKPSSLFCPGCGAKILT